MPDFSQDIDRMRRKLYALRRIHRDDTESTELVNRILYDLDHFHISIEEAIEQAQWFGIRHGEFWGDYVGRPDDDFDEDNENGDNNKDSFDDGDYPTRQKS
jgi:hypothetical protein